jgi:hypothetical protein
MAVRNRALKMCEGLVGSLVALVEFLFPLSSFEQTRVDRSKIWRLNRRKHMVDYGLELIFAMIFLRWLLDPVPPLHSFVTDLQSFPGWIDVGRLILIFKMLIMRLI